MFAAGGLSYFAPELGFACDNVANFEVVLASGEIVNANANSNSDLFRALKGGQNNFGVITRFDVCTNPHHKLWGGGIQYPLSTEDAQLTAFYDLKSSGFDPLVALEMSFLYYESLQSWFVSNNMVYLRPVENPPSMQRFTGIQPQTQSTMRIATVTDLAVELQRVQPMNQ
jgi:FAD/FMN-containing dehydrogenase